MPRAVALLMTAIQESVSIEFLGGLLYAALQIAPFVIDALLLLWSLDALSRHANSHAVGTVSALFISVIAIQGCQTFFRGMSDTFDEYERRRGRMAKSRVTEPPPD